MADVEAQSTLSVEVQGEESLNRLAAAFNNLAQQAQQVQRTVQVTTQRATPASATRAVQDAARKAQEEAGTLGEKIAYRFGYALGATIRAPFDALRATAGVVGRSLASLAGPMGQVATSAGIGATA
ncbi:MAG TPA: hypothetical protein VKE42_02265, partial [Candidatus Cybelea sp.]|nr:hypothetical protein [Candidatus Cybelea sp.]